MKYIVKFGSSWKNDGFGLVGKGAIDIDGPKVTLMGRILRRSINLNRFLIDTFVYLPLILIVLWFDPPFPFNILLYTVVSVVLVIYWIIMWKHYRPKISVFIILKSKIRDITRTKRMITFKIPNKRSGTLRRSVLVANSEEDAKMIEFYLRRR